MMINNTSSHGAWTKLIVIKCEKQLNPCLFLPKQGGKTCLYMSNETLAVSQNIYKRVQTTGANVGNNGSAGGTSTGFLQ